MIGLVAPDYEQESFSQDDDGTFSLCWVDTTMVWTLMGTQAPFSNLYSQVTWKVSKKVKNISTLRGQGSY